MANCNLARNVKDLLKAQRMQQKELAEKMGVAASFLSNALTGNPTIETLQKIASALGVPVSVLLRERDYITGFVEVNGKGYRIDKWEDIQTLISRHERVSNR
jgi:transcriptional regulator with XRE-family HTH domain